MRDKYRNPYETISFFGIKSDMTVVELSPGGGWYTEIFANYLHEPGNLIAAHFDSDSEREYFKRGRANFEKKMQSSSIYNNVTIVDLCLDASDSPTFAGLTTTGDVQLGNQSSDTVTIAGNLIVNGTTVTNSATNTSIEDKLIELGTGRSGSPSGDAGIVIERGASDNVFIGWDESADQVQIATTSATGTSTGDLTLTDANLKAGTITYASLSDGAITITAFVDEDNMASNSATLVPTQQSVKAYVDSQVHTPDDGIVRATITANSSASTFTIGALPNVSGRSYFANKAILKVTTAFSGGSVDGFKITDNESSESTYVTAAQADPTVTGTYVLDLGMETLTAGTTLQLDLVQSDGSTAAVATAGAVTVTVQYVYNT